MTTCSSKTLLFFSIVFYLQKETSLLTSTGVWRATRKLCNVWECKRSTYFWILNSQIILVLFSLWRAWWSQESPRLGCRRWILSTSITWSWTSPAPTLSSGQGEYAATNRKMILIRNIKIKNLKKKNLQNIYPWFRNVTMAGLSNHDIGDVTYDEDERQSLGVVHLDAMKYYAGSCALTWPFLNYNPAGDILWREKFWISRD